MATADEATPFPPGLLAADGRRFVGLDCLRAAAILLILVGHFFFRLPDDTVGRPALFVMRQLGIVAVDVFYVLSGFLVGGVLLVEQLASGGVALRRFFARRAIRLWPSYFLLILLAWKWSHWYGVRDEFDNRVPAVALWDMWPMALFAQNYVNLLDYKQSGASAALQTWTLASIVHFYVIAALLVKGMGAIGRRAVHGLPWVALATAVACFALRWHGAPVDEAHFDAYAHYFPTHLRLDEPMFGLLLAYAVVYHRRRVDAVMARAWPLVLLGSAALLVPVASRREALPPFLAVWGYTTAALAAGGFVMTLWWLEQRRRMNVAAPSRATRLLRWPVRAMATVGVWSYSIYLWHQPLCTQYVENKVRHLVGTRLVPWESPFNYPVTLLAYVLACVATGAAAYYLLERPSWLLRDRLAPRTRPGRRRTVVPPPTTTAPDRPLRKAA